jgi:hypothetical protein
MFTDPNPPTRKNESFPKTTTLPEGWNGDALMSSGSGAGRNSESSPAQSGQRPVPVVDEELFTRRLDPFPKPNTIPTGWDLSEIDS